MRQAYLPNFALTLLVGTGLATLAHGQTVPPDAPRASSACKLKFKSTTLSTGTNPQTIVVADFNKDGKLDFAQVNYSGGRSGSVSVFLGKGNGKFYPPKQYATGPGPDAIAVGDVNGDGNLDLVVGDDTGAAVSVLLGSAKGTFRTHKDYAAGAFPHSVALADFDGDKNLDIAVTNEGDSDVGVLLNKGDGTFGHMKTFPTASEPNVIAVADFNQDGNPDLAITTDYNSVVSILLGKGGGTFHNHVDYATGSGPQAIAAGDFNGDGKPDLAAANYNNGQIGSASILLGEGDGTFKAHHDYPAGLGPDGLAVGDFNGDGNADLAVTNLLANTVSILPGRSGGRFGRHVDFATGTEPVAVAVGQFHGNGPTAQDIIVTNDTNATVTVLRNKLTNGCN